MEEITRVAHRLASAKISCCSIISDLSDESHVDH